MHATTPTKEFPIVPRALDLQPTAAPSCAPAPPARLGPAVGHPEQAPEAPAELLAVLFDMDGTLTDSERLWTISLERVAESYGRTLSRAAREAMVGQDMWATVDLLHRELGIDDEPQATARRLTDETLQVFREGLPFKPGAAELLAAVRSAGLRTALVTATYRNLVDVALDTIGRDAFDVTVCGDEVGANKPDPAPYLRALELLDLPAAGCLVIEDSPTGSRSAAAAGLGVLVVPSEIPVPPGPALLFEDTLDGVDVGRLRDIHAELLDRLQG